MFRSVSSSGTYSSRGVPTSTSITTTQSYRKYIENQSQRERRIDRQLRGIKPGDLISMDRKGFEHYGIYIGNGQVVDFTEDYGGRVSVRSVYDVVGESNCKIDNYLDKKYRPFPPKEIIQRALDSITKSLKYSLALFNCEHFATWIRYGEKKCHQPCIIAATLLTVIQKNPVSQLLN